MSMAQIVLPVSEVARRKRTFTSHKYLHKRSTGKVRSKVRYPQVRISSSTKHTTVYWERTPASPPLDTDLCSLLEPFRDVAYIVEVAAVPTCTVVHLTKL